MNNSTSVTSVNVEAFYISNIVFASIILPTILIGNGLTISAILTHKTLQTKTNILVFSLCISDVCVGLYSMVDLVIHYTGFTFQTKLHLDLFGILKSITFDWSLCHITAIATERYITILYPMKYEKLLAPRRLVVLLAFVWLFPVILLYGPLPFYHLQLLSRRSWEGYANMTQYFIQGIIIIYMYIRILKQVYLQIRKIRELSLEENRDKVAKKQELKATVTLSLVVAAYFLFWIPNVIFYFVLVFAKLEKNWETFVAFSVVSWIGICNSAVNVFIYAGKSIEFKTAYKRLLRCKSCV